MNNEAFVELRFIQGSSDKVYKLSLERDIKDDDNCGWVVNFAYGRYGKPLKTGTKTPKPRGFDKAADIYSKIMIEKQRKGYVCTDTMDGAPDARFQVIQGDKTAWLPQLLNEITSEELNDTYIMCAGHCWTQIKHDGERRGIIFSPDNGIIPANRKGLQTTVAPEIMSQLEDLLEGKRWQGTLDCEDMGDHLRIFDYIPAHDSTLYTFEERLVELKALWADTVGYNRLIVELPIHCTSYAQLKACVGVARLANEEGIVIRDGRGIYTPGRPNSGGTCLKLKFWADCTVAVSRVHDTKRSIQMSMLGDSGSWVVVGNCTIPANYPMPKAGHLVDVKYLYAYRGGSIYQPQYKGERTDIEVETAAVMSQLKYKKD